MADKKSAPARARSSEVLANGNALQIQHSIAASLSPSPQAQSSYSNIPAELQARPQWVVADGDKRPINPRTGHAASPTDPGTWGTFEQACAYATAHDLRVGFALTANDPYCVIDLDDKPGKPASENERKAHADILEHFPTYIERSTSGRGYHVVLRGVVGPGRRRGNVEVYDRQRYMIFTGDVVRQAPIAECQKLLHGLLAKMPNPAEVGALQELPQDFDDDVIVQRARDAANGEKFARLMVGDWRAMSYPSQSEADFALMEFLSNYSISNEQCRRIFKASKLYRLKKTTRAYMDRMLGKLRTHQDTSDVRTDVATWFPQAGHPMQGQPSDGAGEDDLPPVPGPMVTNAMYYGVTGQVMRAACDGTEVHPAAVGTAFLSFASAALGRNRWVQIGNKKHHARLYTAHVGRSGIGGKGMALELPQSIREEAESKRDPVQDGQFACGNFHDGGLSSREGLAYLIRDESDTKEKDGTPTDPGVDDKRLFVVEEEFANVSRQTKREGNTLSAAMRTAWDGGTIAPATKSNRTRATEPHIAIHANITPTELRVSLDNNDLTNGFANRFLFCYAERIGVVPIPMQTPKESVECFAAALLAAIRHARVSGEVRATDAAKRRFATFYRAHRRGLGLTAQMRGLLERHPSYAWRLALTFALLDRKDEIDDAHMAAALAWLDYYRESTRYIFSTAREEVAASKVASLGEHIVEQLRQAVDQTMDREPLRIATGKPNVKELNAALQELQDAGAVEEVVTQRKNGWPQRQYRLKAMAPLSPVADREGAA